MNSLVRLTHLIRLELIRVCYALYLDTMYEERLSIEELVLIDCEDAEAYLLTAKSTFSRLKRLHIEETEEESRKPLQMGRLYEDGIMQCIQGIDAALNQPDIEQVSGNSKFLAHCMRNDANKFRFQRSFCSGKLISENSRYTTGMQLKLWVKL